MVPDLYPYYFYPEILNVDLEQTPYFATSALGLCCQVSLCLLDHGGLALHGLACSAVGWALPAQMYR